MRNKNLFKKSYEVIFPEHIQILRQFYQIVCLFWGAKAFQNSLLKDRQKKTEDEEENVGSYWMALTRKYWKLKDEAFDRTVCRTGFGRGYGTVVRQTA